MSLNGNTPIFIKQRIRKQAFIFHAEYYGIHHTFFLLLCAKFDDLPSKLKMSANDEMLSDFTTVTGIAEDRAKFYLESANWNLQVSTSKFNVSVFIELSESASQCLGCLSVIDFQKNYYNIRISMPGIQIIVYFTVGFIKLL